MKAYSEDLRQKIVEATERGLSKAQAARLFGVSLSSVKRYVRLARQGGSLAPGKGSGRPPKIDENAKKLLEKDVEERPAATVSERRRFLEHITGSALSDSTRRTDVEADGLHSKKRSVGAVEREEFLRVAWKTMVAEKLYVGRLVFVDEMGTNTSLAPLYAWAPKGEPRASGGALLGSEKPW